MLYLARITNVNHIFQPSCCFKKIFKMCIKWSIPTAFHRYTFEKKIQIARSKLSHSLFLKRTKMHKKFEETNAGAYYCIKYSFSKRSARNQKFYVTQCDQNSNLRIVGVIRTYINRKSFILHITAYRYLHTLDPDHEQINCS